MNRPVPLAHSLVLAVGGLMMAGAAAILVSDVLIVVAFGHGGGAWLGRLRLAFEQDPHFLAIFQLGFALLIVGTAIIVVGELLRTRVPPTTPPPPGDLSSR